MAKSYSEKLKDPRWQRKRLGVFNRDNWTCVKCGDNSNTLHIHHKVYFKNKEPWEYENQYLETLCELCHKKEHDLILEDKEPDRKIINSYSDNTLEAIQNHIDLLMVRLEDKFISRDLENTILRNIIFLQKQKKEYLNG